jgi:hypothetical protein
MFPPVRRCFEVVRIMKRRTMMKKLLVLLTVVGLAAMASATLQISVEGDRDPTESEWGILPSQHLVLDIWTDAEILPGSAEEGWWCLIVLPEEASITGGASLITEESGITIYPGPVPAPPVPGANGVYGLIALGTISGIDADTTIYDGIDFHCEDMIDATVILAFGPAIGAWTEVDRVVIHQPEPMTVALLGLGGLFLRRRRK